MKRTVMFALAVTLLLTGVRAAEQATWDEQNTVMGWFILHISGVNAINGLNLTRDQAVQLRGLAREMEAVAPTPPAIDKTFRPDLAEVRDTYSELRGVLLKGQDVPKDLEAKVYRARGVEASVIRLSLANPKANATGCQRCHGEPNVADVRAKAGETLSDVRMSAKANPKDTFTAHMMGAYGVRGSIKLLQRSPDVDKILNESQKDIVRNFSCCLVPPKGLSDPVRAGQAAGGEKEFELLRFVRNVPAEQWPTFRKMAMEKLDQMVAGKSPGATDVEKGEARKRVGAVYDKVRSMSETDFEMEKANLAAELHGAQSNSASLDQNGQRFMAAYFLLLPGSGDVYDGLIQRMK